MSDTNVTVVVTQDNQPQVTLFGVCFVGILAVMFVIHFWVYIVATLGAAAILSLTVWLYQRSESRKAKLRADADQQTRWLAEGDPRGTYGDWSGDGAP